MTMRRHSFVSPSPTPTVAASLKLSPRRSDRQRHCPTANPPAHRSSPAPPTRVKPSPSLPTPSGTPTDLGTFSFLWERSANTDFSDTPVTLQDSTSTTYLLTDDDAAAFIRVTVSYTDGGGFSETITSAVRQISHATRPRTHRRTGHHRRPLKRVKPSPSLPIPSQMPTDLGDLQLPVGAQHQYRLQRYASDATRLGQHHLSAHR